MRRGGLPGHFGNCSKWLMVSFLTQASLKINNKKKRQETFYVCGQMPNPSSLFERTDTQLSLVFIAQKLLTCSSDHIAARGLAQFSSGDASVSRVLLRYLGAASFSSFWNC